MCVWSVYVHVCVLLEGFMRATEMVIHRHQINNKTRLLQMHLFLQMSWLEHLCDKLSHQIVWRLDLSQKQRKGKQKNDVENMHRTKL